MKKKKYPTAGKPDFRLPLPPIPPPTHGEAKALPPAAASLTYR